VCCPSCPCAAGAGAGRVGLVARRLCATGGGGSLGKRGEVGATLLMASPVCGVLARTGALLGLDPRCSGAAGGGASACSKSEPAMESEGTELGLSCTSGGLFTPRERSETPKRWPRRSGVTHVTFSIIFPWRVLTDPLTESGPIGAVNQGIWLPLR
jgi:hypothetical protein